MRFPAAYEAASHRYLRREIQDSRTARRTRQARRRRRCALHASLETHAGAFQRLRAQVEWNAHHWQRLAERLRAPVPPPRALRAERLSAPYTSALYGKMDDSDMDVSHGR